MSDNTCAEDKSFISKFITPYLAPIIVAFIVSSVSAWSMVKINANDNEHAVKQIINVEQRVEQEAKRNNIQDVTIAKVQEKQLNQDLTLSRIENTLSSLNIDLKEFMQNIPKEMKSLTKEISEINKSVAILNDREERKKEVN